LENLDDVVLVLGEDLSETIGSLDEIVNLRAGHVTTATKTETLSVVDVGAETELTRSLTSDTDGITSQHLDRETESLGFVDSAGSVVTRGVRAGHDSEDFPRALTTLASNTERTETTGSELSNLVLVGLVNLLGNRVVLLDGLENEQRGTLDADNALALGRLDNSGNLLGDGIEGVEVDDLVLREDTLGAGVVLERLEESLVDGIHTLLLAGSGQASGQHEILRVNTGDSVGLGERELVLGEGTSLVRAENLDTGKRLDGGQLLDDGLLLGKVGGTDSHGGGNDSGKTDGDTDDGDSKGVLENQNNRVGAVERADPDDQKGEDDEDEQNSTDTVQNLSEMTLTAGSSVDESGGTTDEGVVTSGSDDNKGLTTLDTGRSIALVTLVLVDGKRFTSDGGLIDLKEGILGDDATIGRDNGTFLDLKNITGDDLGSLNLLEGTVTENNSLKSESLLQLVDDGTSLVFLDETNGGVEQEKGADDTEINPILETGGKNGSSLHDELDRTNEETEELEDQVLLLLLHLVETILLASRQDFALGKTDTSVGHEHVLRNNTATAGLNLFLLIIIDVAILGLEILDKSIHILIRLLILLVLLASWGRGSHRGLLIEVACGTRASGNIVFRHWDC
jgi:hypothetical protein